MKETTRGSRVLLIAGLAAMVVGALDPMEGSVVILGGTVLAALGALLGHCRRRALAYEALALVVVGVAALFGLSAVGGIGGSSGRSMWWAFLVLPYAVGWVIGLVGAIQNLRDEAPPSVPTAAH